MEITTAQLIQTLFSTVIVLLLILLLRMLRNGGAKERLSTRFMEKVEEAGKGQICMKRGTQLQKHESELEHLIKDLDEEKEDRKLFRRDITTAIGNVYKELRRMNGVQK